MPGDYDYFRLRVTAYGQLIVYTTGSTDTYGVLESSGGVRLTSNNNSGASRNFRIVRNGRGTGHPITSASMSTVIMLRERITYTRGFVSDDHRNSRSGATSISLNRTRSGRINLYRR